MTFVTWPVPPTVTWAVNVYSSEGASVIAGHTRQVRPSPWQFATIVAPPVAEPATYATSVGSNDIVGTAPVCVLIDKFLPCSVYVRTSPVPASVLSTVRSKRRLRYTQAGEARYVGHTLSRARTVSLAADVSPPKVSAQSTSLPWVGSGGG